MFISSKKTNKTRKKKIQKKTFKTWKERFVFQMFKYNGKQFEEKKSTKSNNFTVNNKITSTRENQIKKHFELKLANTTLKHSTIVLSKC